MSRLQHNAGLVSSRYDVDKTTLLIDSVLPKEKFSVNTKYLCSLQLNIYWHEHFVFKGNGVDNYSQIKDSVRCWAAGEVWVMVCGEI